LIPQNSDTQTSLNTLTIGNFQLDNQLCLAPMAGVADAPFRQVCREFGAALSTSEMLTSDMSIWHQPKSQWRLRWSPIETPISVQIAGTEPELMARAAEKCNQLGAQIIDINMGCPAKKVCKKMAGSALMANESLISAIVSQVTRAVSCPVTVKIRTGTNIDNKNAVRIAQVCEAEGAQAIAVHGRTRACKFVGEIDYATIAAVKNGVTIPVIANGDIQDHRQTLEVLHKTQANAVMIGRAALGKPWIFRQILEFIHLGEVHYQPSFEEIGQVVIRHIKAIHNFYGLEKGLGFARKHISWYAQHLDKGHLFRSDFHRQQTAQAQLNSLYYFFQVN